ncbi:threonine-phosphate decarboxylase CobD [Clostridium septicum]|uniref:threonine-phosphate decarboxylase n=1 Tax=Clostridium septicum TaxID=1504 RepID=A0A9N7PJX9_CLOSE|nr:threonine-phosphate decarboxylase CobD [Clostridium septicum]AYE35261.1 threonine-phosphate decarboxylase [Clostridium septicum]MDU1313684.1 threonine-phosphate decarboxylase CobD [Clostridium septicum]QAS60656.1 threonine-phosphate decarboxylase [Clostridium septicum]UEC20089.1 threonine-phosphate decarboxylase CobD [Clostridium septicum]USS01855.1 threonine-phosphate decarboxylase CobD [Clostridium septicum]
MTKSIHGGNTAEISRKYGMHEDEIIDFSANINPLGLNKEVKKAMINAIDKVSKYPDITYYNLKKSISNYECINEENLILGNGAAEVIFNVVRGLNPKRVLIPAPTFGEYEEAVLSIDGEIEYYYLSEENKFNLDGGLIDKIDETIDMVFICNPNNPTGVVTSNKYIEEIAKKALKTKTIVVLDESFLDFVDNSEEFTGKYILNKYNNIIIIKSLTKFFAMPGIRIGYGISNNKSVIEKINKVTVAWSINSVAVDGVIEALMQKEYIEDTKKYLNLQKEYLYNELKSFKDLKVFKPSVNFIMFKVLKNIDFKDYLIKRGILIRSCNNYKGLDNNYYRVAVRTKEENNILIQAIKTVF